MFGPVPSCFVSVIFTVFVHLYSAQLCCAMPVHMPFVIEVELQICGSDGTNKLFDRVKSRIYSSIWREGVFLFVLRDAPPSEFNL